MPETPRSAVPKYRQIEQFLLEEIERGNYLPGQSFITEGEVCRNFGVSRITAVRALNDLVQQGVLERRRGVGTFVKGAGAPPPARPTRGLLVGALFHEIHGHHVLEILAGIEEVCRESEASLVLYDSGSRVDWEAANLARAREAGVAGLIVYPVDGQANAAEFAGAGLPLVMVDRYYPPLATDAVLFDSFGGTLDVLGALLDGGHRRVAVVWGEVACTSVVESHVAVRRALATHGLPLDPDLFLLAPYDSLPERTRHRRLRSWLASGQSPTAFVAANVHTLSVLRADLVAVGADLGALALGALHNDNPALLEAVGGVAPDLPSRQIGVTATRRLLERLRGGGPARHIVLSSAGTPVGQPDAQTVST